MLAVCCACKDGASLTLARARAGGAAAAGKLSLWNMRTFKRVASFAVPGDPPLGALSFSADGRQLLAAGADGFARLFDAGDRSQARAPV